MKRHGAGIIVLLIAEGWVCACNRGASNFKAGVHAELLGDYDGALKHYELAAKSNPTNPAFLMKRDRARFEAAQAHLHAGQVLAVNQDLQGARKQFELAVAADPGSPIARQELERVTKLLRQPEKPVQVPPQSPPSEMFSALASKPPELAHLPEHAVSLKLANDARVVFQTVAKLCGVNVIFDPDFQSRHISIELVDVTLKQALDYVALESRAFWKPLSRNTILVLPDQPQKRKEQEEEVMRTFYLSHTLAPQDVNEIVTALRSMLDLRRVQLLASQNAIFIRDTPDKMLLAEKLIRDADKSKPEVVVQVSVLQARRDLSRSLGVQPSTSVNVMATPRTGLAAENGPAGTVSLGKLKQLRTNDYSVTLPDAVATALLSDSTTKIIQNPEIRVADGQSAKLRVGDRVPVATGSFQAGVGAGGTISPLVNTQFQYIDVGVNIDITPHVHANREISLKVSVEISSVSSRVNIGGIDQPVISQRRIEHDIRLREGEVSILGGLSEHSDSKSVGGWPGLSRLPILRYLFSGESVNATENEVLIVLNPRIVRLPEITPTDQMTLSVGTEANPQVRFKEEVVDIANPQPAERAAKEILQEAPADAPMHLRFDPPPAPIAPNETGNVPVVIEGARDLFTFSLQLRYDPAAVAVEEVQHGGFLAAGSEDAVIQRIDREKGTATILVTRQPNTAGVSGSGVLVRLVIRRLRPGPTKLQVDQAAARDSRQHGLSVDVTQPSLSLP
jgi:general secretion pathway protein D